METVRVGEALVGDLGPGVRPMRVRALPPEQSRGAVALTNAIDHPLDSAISGIMLEERRSIRIAQILKHQADTCGRIVGERGSIPQHSYSANPRNGGERCQHRNLMTFGAAGAHALEHCRTQRRGPDSLPKVERMTAAVAARPAIAPVWARHFGPV